MVGIQDLARATARRHQPRAARRSGAPSRAPARCSPTRRARCAPRRPACRHRREPASVRRAIARARRSRCRTTCPSLRSCRSSALSTRGSWTRRSQQFGDGSGQWDAPVGVIVRSRHVRLAYAPARSSVVIKRSTAGESKQRGMRCERGMLDVARLADDRQQSRQDRVDGGRLEIGRLDVRFAIGMRTWSLRANTITSVGRSWVVMVANACSGCPARWPQIECRADRQQLRRQYHHAVRRRAQVRHDSHAG